MAMLHFPRVGEKWEVRKGIDKVLLGHVENRGTPPFFFKGAQAINAEAILTSSDLRELADFIEQANRDTE